MVGGVMTYRYGSKDEDVDDVIKLLDTYLKEKNITDDEFDNFSRQEQMEIFKILARIQVQGAKDE
jgi:hypothetical protein